MVAAPGLIGVPLDQQIFRAAMAGTHQRVGGAAQPGLLSRRGLRLVPVVQHRSVAADRERWRPVGQRFRTRPPARRDQVVEGAGGDHPRGHGVLNSRVKTLKFTI